MHDEVYNIPFNTQNLNADTLFCRVGARLYFMKALADLAREEDPSRLISAACLVNHTKLRIEDRLAAFIDIIGLNEYYGWYEESLKNWLLLVKIHRQTVP